MRNPDNGSVGRDVSDRPVFKGIGSRASEGAMMFRSTVDDVQRLGFYKQSDRYPLVIVITKAQSDVLARWRQNTLRRLLFGPLSLVCPDCADRTLSCVRITAWAADGSPSRQGSQFPRAGGRLERHGDPHRTG